MGNGPEWVGFTAGIVVVAATVNSLVRTVIVPRGFASSLTAAVEKGVQAVFLAASRRLESYKSKDRLLVLQAPLSLLAMLATWLMLFWVGYGLILWPLADLSFRTALREAGSSMLTLGFAASPGAGPTAVHFVAAATGLVVIALLIAYLPTLYGAFNRRETLVTTLQSRAGIPAWGPEILARHHAVNSLDALPDFYREWERWAADVGESHSNYPVLIYFRSPHPLRNWVLGLLAVIDSAALYQSLCPSTAPSESRLAIRMGFTSLRDIAGSIGLPYDPDPMPDDPIHLTYEEFLAGIERLRESGFPIERSAEEAWPHFRGWRVNYEGVAYALADRVVAAPGLWSGPRTHVPDLVIPPLRPVDRRPDDPASKAQPRQKSEWKI
jgi:hypothetical protein